MKKTFALIITLILILAIPFSAYASVEHIILNPAENGSVTCEEFEAADAETALLFTCTPDNGYELDFISVTESNGPFEHLLFFITPDMLSGNTYVYTSDSSYDTITVTSVFKKGTTLIIMGDYNGDVSVLVDDALAVLRMAARMSEVTKLDICDMDFDGEITVSDALAVLRIAAKLK